MPTSKLLELLLALATHAVLPSLAFGGQPLRIGILGCDTSHVPAFTKIINNEANHPDSDKVFANMQVVAAFPGGSADIPASNDRVGKFSEQLREMGVELVDSIEALLARVDVVLLESVDGRKHLEQVRPVFAAGKPVFIDKPLAGTLADAVEIVQLSEKHKTPFFSSSMMRFVPTVRGIHDNNQLGEIVGCTAYSPCILEPHHPDLFWYGIHGVETLFAIMGPGCERVTRTQTDGAEFVVGVWKEGRIGAFHGIREGKNRFGALVVGTKSIQHIERTGDYAPLVVEIAKFFKTGQTPVSAKTTLEIMAFMEAADESKRQDGRPVSLESVLAKARAEVSARSLQAPSP